jgi:hypothetical protein
MLYIVVQYNGLGQFMGVDRVICTNEQGKEYTELLLFRLYLHYRFCRYMVIKMNTIKHIDICYPPGSSTVVGGVDVTRQGETTTIHKEFLEGSFGKDVVVAGRLLRERRENWATNRAISALLFHADAVLGSEIPGRLAAYPDLTM